MLIECDVQGFAPRQELYLPDLQLLGTLTEIYEDENSCKLEISAAGLTTNCEQTTIAELLKTMRLEEIKKQWTSMSTVDKRTSLTALLGSQSTIAILRGSFIPHDYASDTDAIESPDLIRLLFDAKALYEELSSAETIPDFYFKFVEGPPGCGKTTLMLD